MGLTPATFLYVLALPYMLSRARNHKLPHSTDSRPSDWFVMDLWFAEVGPLTGPGNPVRPSWMDIRLDDAASLAERKIRLKPVALRSLIGAGYRCLGDLRWVSNRELRQFHYIGIKTAQQIRAVVERFENAG